MQDRGSAEDSVVSVRTMEIVVALLFLGVSAIVIADSLRVGAGWVEPEGPRAGYFPMRIGIVMGIASLVTLLQAVFKGGASSRSFVDREPFKQVLLILLPAIVYVALIEYVGIYVMSTIYIAGFMLYIGRYGWLTSLAVGLCVAAALFLMFEIWFLVPLPKGPVEALFGY